MTLEDYNFLNEMLLGFRRELEEMNVQINYNLRCIREAEVHLKSLQETESEDFKVFSPRKAAIIYKEEIEKIHDEKSRYEENNKTLYQTKVILKKRIIGLENVLSHQSCDFTSQGERVRKSLTDVPKILEDLSAKIGRSSNDIARNPIQAKQDFIIIGRDLKNLADELKNAVSTQSEVRTEIEKLCSPSEEIIRKGDEHTEDEPLTEREEEILKLVARGMLNKEIADSLHITEQTVKNHLFNLYRKINVGDRTQATIYAVQKGLVRI